MKIKHVVVLDDNRRFFLHVWRYLSGLPGFGVGNVSAQWRKDESKGPLHPDNGASRDVAGGMCFVWWVDAKDSPRKTIEAVLGQITARGADTNEIVAVLIDRGDKKYGDSSLSDIWSFLTSRGLEGAIQLVSAYRAGAEAITPGHEVTILPKTDKLLEDVRKRVRASRCDAGTRGNVEHVLITGAGFEMREKEGGLGLPGTPGLLEQMHGHLGADWTKEWRNDWTFPIIQPGDPQSSEAAANADDLLAMLHEAARVGGLDRYFTALILLTRSKDKVAAMNAEMAIREAFREVLLGYDWGQMQQSIDAAELPWTAWISTNYTGFADRAIRAAARGTGSPRWFVISSADQAAIIHHIQLERTLSKGPDFVAMPTPLFKVHGDIGDVRTMALAGEDKVSQSDLRVTVRSLFQVYAAAQQSLEWLLKGKEVVFHIVGHDMRDEILNGLLRNVGGRATRITFVMVNPDLFGRDGNGPLQRLKEECAPQRQGNINGIRAFPLKASEYMARLRAGWSDVIEGGDPGEALKDLMAVGERWRDDTVRGLQTRAKTFIDTWRKSSG